MKNFILTLFTINTLLFGTNCYAETFTDTSSGLQWQDDLAAKETSKIWTEAIAYCEELTLASHTDWRLPNRKELISITDFSSYPVKILTGFQNYTGAKYWSSSTYPKSGAIQAFYVNNFPSTAAAAATYKTYTLNVRCVRGGNIAVSATSDYNPALINYLLD